MYCRFWFSACDVCIQTSAGQNGRGTKDHRVSKDPSLRHRWYDERSSQTILREQAEWMHRSDKHSGLPRRRLCIGWSTR